MRSNRGVSLMEMGLSREKLLTRLLSSLFEEMSITLANIT